jgi:hypothetical protein
MAFTKAQVEQYIEALNTPCSDPLRVVECILTELLKEKLIEEKPPFGG